MIVRRLARPLLAAVFVWGGVQTLRNPDTRLKSAGPFLERTVGSLRESLPDQVPTDPATLVKLDAAVKIGAGLTLGLGKFPRLSALLLTGSMVPTTLAAHAYWEHEDPAMRTNHQTHFLKNLGLVGGLLLAVSDTSDRDRRAAKRAAAKAKKKSRKG